VGEIPTDENMNHTEFGEERNHPEKENGRDWEQEHLLLRIVNERKIDKPVKNGHPITHKCQSSDSVREKM